MRHRDKYRDLRRWLSELRETQAGPELIQALEQRIEEERDEELRHILLRVLVAEHENQGNAAAAKKVRRGDPLYRIEHWCMLLQRRRRRTDVVRAIEQRLLKETEPRVRYELKQCLAKEHELRGNYASAEALFLQLFDENPDQPFPLSYLASQKFHLENKPEEGMAMIDRTIEAAHRSGVMPRFFLGDKARMALELEDYALVEEILKEIMATFLPENQDVRPERDFFDRLPPGTIDAEVARQYAAFCEAHGRYKKKPST